MNIGKWVLKNLFLGFIREEQRLQRKLERSSSRDRNHDSSHDPPKLRSPRTTTSVISSGKMLQAVAPTVSGFTRSSPLLAPMIPLNIPKENALPLPAIPQLPTIHSNDATPMPRRHRSDTLDSLHQSSAHKEGDYFSVPTRRPSITASTPDELLVWNGVSKIDAGLQTPTTPSSGLMGRLKNFGKNKKIYADTVNTISVANDPATAETMLEVRI